MPLRGDGFLEVFLIVVLVILGLFSFTDITSAADQPQDFIWWEGESPVSTNFPGYSDFSSDTFMDVKDDVLSKGDWLSISGRREAGDPEVFAKYKIDVKTEGTFNFWTRKFWKHGPFRWRFDSAKWETCGSDCALSDNTDIRQFLCANWVFLGKVKLTKGKHTFEIRLLAKEGQDTTAAFDAFLLAKGPFMPQGRLRPGGKWNLSDKGFFPYEPGLDNFSSSALLDLRGLNEKVAGESGFIRKDGESFVLGNGKPVRFWAVNISSENAGQDRDSINYMARRLAKLGVNMVRFHSPIFDPSSGKVNQRTLDNLFYLISAMKKQGIYTTVSFYFPLWIDMADSLGITGYKNLNNKKPFALLYFNEQLESMYRNWIQALFTTKNPYTGQTLANEPALAITELINEDSFFFWTFTKANVPEVHWKRLERRFGEWLAQRYGSIDKAFDAWGKAMLPADNAGEGSVGLYEAWDMTKDGSHSGGTAKVRRVGDQVRFLTELQRGFYESTVQYIKGELKARCLISPSNWTVSDGPTLDALERYTYTAGDVIDRHGYFNSKHTGEGSDYSVRVGHTFTSSSALNQPDGLPLQVFQVVGYPHIVSELGWTQPNRFRADFTFLSSAYGALQGIDGLYFFAIGNNFLSDTSMGKFQVGSPAVIGTFPAAALQYRLGYVKESQDVIHQKINLEDLYAMKGSGTSTASALDDLRKRDIPLGGEAVGSVNKLDPLSFYVGKVVREYSGDPENSVQIDLPEYINRNVKTVKSVTGELSWNYGDGLVKVDTPCSQGASGFLGEAGKLEFGDITVEFRNEYGSIQAISLDGRPLNESKKILVQTMTEDQPYGFKATGNSISDIGKAPFEIKNIEAAITLKGKGGKLKVTALDMNGYPTKKPVTVASVAEGQKVSLRGDTIYHIITR